MKLNASLLLCAKRLLLFLPIPGIIAAVTYGVKLSPSVYPGVSAGLAAQAFRVLPPSEAAHPLFSLVARGVASLGFSSLPVRLNLFSALCGTLCALLLYHLVSRLILLSACDTTDSGREDFSKEDSTYHGEPVELDDYTRRLLSAAFWGGCVASVLFIFMTPVLSAATRLDKGLFDLLLALAFLSLFPLSNTPYRYLRLALSAFVFVLGLYNSAVFLLMLPCYAFFLFRLFLWCSRRGAIIGWLAVAGIAGSMFSVYAYAQNHAGPEGSTLWMILVSYAKALPHHHYRELRSFFPHAGWALVLAQTGVPVLILLFGRSILFKERRVRMVLALLLVTLVSIPALLNLSISPFFIFQPVDHLPVFGSALTATVTALALAACLIFMRREESWQEASWGLRGIVVLVLPILGVLTLVASVRSLHTTNTRCGLFADEAARAMLERMNGRTWIISNGYLDSHLLIQAAMIKQPLTLVTVRPQELPQESARLKRIIASSPDFEGLNRQRLQNALSLGSVRFVREWFMTDPEAGRRAMVFATPDLWTSCGYVAVPEGLAFGGVRPDQKLVLTSLAQESQKFINRFQPLLLQQNREFGYASVLSEVLRMKVGLAANELGVLLEDQGETEAAYQMYVRASHVDPKNISAVVNGYVLARAQKMHTEELASMIEKIKALTADLNDQTRALTWILQNYGTIRRQTFYLEQAKIWSSIGARTVATDKIRKALALSDKTGVNALIEDASVYVQSGDPVKAEACYVSALEKDPASRGALTGMTLLMLKQNKLPESGKWLQKTLDAGIDKDALLYPSITLAILQKDKARALTLLEEATQKFPTDLRYWTLQADILLEQGDTFKVEQTILPKMQKALKNPDHFLIHSVRGFLLKKKGPAHFMESRNCLLRALSINAGMPDIWNALLELDLALGKSEFIEMDARNLLNVDPEQALANYLIGSLLLARGKLKDSEDFLRRSIDKRATATACNDLGENLRRQGKLAEAEDVARKALVIDPGLAPALDTLACILYDAGKYEEAAQQAAKAVAAQPKHPSVHLTLLRIQIKQGDYEGIRERVKALSALKTAIPPELQKEIDALKKNQKKG